MSRHFLSQAPSYSSVACIGLDGTTFGTTSSRKHAFLGLGFHNGAYNSNQAFGSLGVNPEGLPLANGVVNMQTGFGRNSLRLLAILFRGGVGVGGHWRSVPKASVGLLYSDQFGQPCAMTFLKT